MRSQSQIYHYISGQFAPEAVRWESVYAKAESIYPGMQVSPVEGKLLQLLLRLVDAKYVAEIGTFVGTSTLWMAEAIAEGGQIFTCEHNPDHVAIARGHFEQYAPGKITLLEGSGVALASQFEDGYFDVIFIDAEKRSYLKYLEAWLPKLRKGGLIIGDNTLLFGAVAGLEPSARTSPEATQVMQQFNAALSDATKFDAVLIPTHEGLTVARKKF